MKKTAIAAISLAALSLAACGSDNGNGDFLTIENMLDGKSSPATIDLAEIYPDSDIYLVCPYGGDDANAKMGSHVFTGEDENDSNNFIVSRMKDPMFEDSFTKEALQRDKIDLCGGENPPTAVMLDSTEVTFEKDGERWVMVD